MIDHFLFASNPWRVHMQILIAIGKANDLHVTSATREMIAVANVLAVVGLPKVIRLLKEDDNEPISHFSDPADSVLRA